MPRMVQFTTILTFGLLGLVRAAPTPAPQEASSVAPVRIMAFGASIVESVSSREFHGTTSSRKY